MGGGGALGRKGMRKGSETLKNGRRVTGSHLSRKLTAVMLLDYRESPDWQALCSASLMETAIVTGA